MNAKQLMEQASTLRFTQEMHCEMGDKFIFRLMRCDADPRLTVLTRYDRKLETITQVWQVDDVDHTDSKSAFGALLINKEGVE